MAQATARRWALRLAAAAIAAAVLIIGGTFLYIHVIEGTAPAPLSLHRSPAARHSASAAATTGNPTAAVAGRWQVGAGSVVGYRVKEVLFGQDNIAVGRTSKITGNITIGAGAVTAGKFTVAMATITSDQSQRDGQFRGRIMDTSAYPTGTLVLTRPIPLGQVSANGVVRSYTAGGDLALHGHTRPVTFTLHCVRTSAGFEVSGSIPVLFSRWGIPNPSFGGAITTQDHGELEFLLRFSRS